MVSGSLVLSSSHQGDELGRVQGVGGHVADMVQVSLVLVVMEVVRLRPGDTGIEVSRLDLLPDACIDACMCGGMKIVVPA